MGIGLGLSSDAGTRAPYEAGGRWQVAEGVV